MQCITESFMDSICCHKYTEVNNCVVRGVLVENRLLSKSERFVLSKKAIVMHSKMSICFAVSPFVLFAEVEFSCKINEL